jgi:zinc/manganese transport system substrate-binding protein
MRQLSLLVAVALASCLAAGSAAADPVKVVASENFYGDLAQQIGGANVEVTSILTNPDQDPHLFEASASTARNLASAKVVIVNGADYDPWMEKLLSANKAPGRKEIVVAKLVHKKSGDNPHLWYDPATIQAFAKVFAAELSSMDPAHKADYAHGAGRLAESLKPLEAKLAEMKEKYAGQPVTASEPVFGYMAQAIGLKMRNERFQLAVMNDTEPSASDIAAFENDLKNHKVKVMLYNSQASDPAVQRLVRIARQSNVPVVGVTETKPAGENYQEWMLDQLNVLDRALAGRNS